MNGREHYDAAESLLSDTLDTHDFGTESKAAILAEAQVHAILALASVQSAFYYSGARAFGEPIDDRDPWSTPPVGLPEDKGEVA